MNELSVLTTEYLSRTDTPLAIMLNSLFDGVYIVDKHMGIVFWNKGAEQITGYSADEVRGRFCSDDILNHIDENGVLLCRGNCPLRQTFKRQAPVEMKVYPKRKTGGRVPVLTHVAPIYNEMSEIIAAIEVFRDITREEEYRTLQEKFTQLLSQYVSLTTMATVRERIHQQGTLIHPVKKRDLTILYLDVVSFTPYAEENEPEKVVAMLNELFSMCDQIVTQHNGDIDKFIGDALMAVFIAADDAVAAADVILKELWKWNQQREQMGDPAIQVRIGINSGIVTQGDIGSPKRKDLTVIGDPVNIAARIESIAKPNTVTISEATYARLTDSSKFQTSQKISVKGKSEPIVVFEKKCCEE
ncbi:MAG: adenylate/guanylate cyclase domain-containing protein [bacterium]|nr:adenylate/guanylate cyclase domain-containing protein [bacterium]